MQKDDLFVIILHVNISELLAEPPADPLIQLVESATVFGMSDWVVWILVVVLLLVSGLFSASENAFSNCNKYHFKVLADEGNVTAKIIVLLAEKFEHTLVTVLIGNNIVQTLISFMTAVLFYNLLAGTSLGNYEAIISTVVVGFLVYVVSDTVPKIISKAMPNKTAIFLAWPDFIFYIILFPIVFLFKQILALTHKIFKIKEKNVLTKEEFIDQVDEAISEENVLNESEQLFEPNEINMIKKAFAFDQVKASQIFTPLTKVKAINIKSLNVRFINKFIMENKYSRYPVYDGKIDNIVGILSVNYYFKEYAFDKHLDIRSVLAQPLFVDEHENVDEIFKKLNREKVHVAIVRDSNNKVIGMLTMEDILDELIDDSAAMSSDKEAKK